MGIVALSKVRIFGVKKNQDALLEELQKLGVVELRKLGPESYRKTKIQSEEYMNKLERVLEILEAEAKLGFKAQTQIQYLSEEEFFARQRDILQDNYNLVDEIYDVQQKITEKELELNNTENQLDMLSALKNVEITPLDLEPGGYFVPVLGKIEKEHLTELQKISLHSLCDFDILSQTQDSVYVFLFCYKEYYKDILNDLKLVEFQEWTGPVPKKDSFKILYTDLFHQKLNLVQKIENLKIQLQSYTASLKRLQIFYDYLSNKIAKDLAQFYIQEDAFLFCTEAYIPTHKITVLEKTLERISGCDYDILALDEQEEYPSLIQNSKLVQPFEFVTDIYSRPGKEDLDPTPFFAPFFAVFMGIAVGDAGIGLVLALLSHFARKKLRLAESTRKLLGICFYGGLMSIVVGIITGTYFAIPFEKMGIHVPYLYQPEKQIMLALGISLTAGFIHLTFGYCIRFAHLLKRGDIFGAIFDGLTHIIVMLCGLMAVLGMQIPSLKYLTTVATNIFIVDVIAIWATSGRHYSDSFVGRLLWGFYGVYELTAIVGDLLSYARLFALGLAGGIIAAAINELTPQLLVGIHFNSIGSSISAIIMIILFFVILLVGHIFAAVISILGAFIHTMRLQFVEFFGKFFQGGGEAFNPLQIRSKYFWIKKNIDVDKP